MDDIVDAKGRVKEKPSADFKWVTENPRLHRSAVQTYPFGVGARVEPGTYRFPFRVRGTPGQSVDLELAGGTRRVRHGAPIPLTETWRDHCVEPGVDAAPTAEQVLRFNPPRGGRGTFDLAASHLRALP